MFDLIDSNCSQQIFNQADAEATTPEHLVLDTEFFALRIRAEMRRLDTKF
jgi:hypothetical protein